MEGWTIHGQSARLWLDRPPKVADALKRAAAAVA
jgi:hypothetical protein